MKLKDICKYKNEKIEVAKINDTNYISTENLLSNFRGYIKASNLPNVNKVNKYDKENILISNIRPYFKKMIYSTNTGGSSNDVLILEVINKKTIPEYLFFYLMNDEFFNYVTNTSKGTKMPRGDKQAIMEYDINIPSLEYQKKILYILKNLTKKIKINNQINDNLHELVNCIYNDSFKNNILRSEKLGNHTECILGGTPSRNKSEYWNGNINWINSGEVNKFRILSPSEKITELGLKKSSTTLLPKNTTVIAITGATLGQVSRLEIESCANQSVVGIVANKDLTDNYIYLSVLNNIEDITKNQTGGAQQHINKGNVEDFKIYVPTEMELKIFEEKVTPLFNKISLNCKENIVLEQIRDTLLPKLMNGEIDLDKIEV